MQLLPEARPGCLKPEAAARMEFVQEVIGMIRTIRAELNIAPSYRLTVLLRPSDAHQKDVLEANREVILTLARLGELIIDAKRRGSRVERLFLTGPTNIVCKGQITDETLPPDSGI